MAGRRPGTGVARWLHWVARGLGTLVAGFWVFAGLMEAFAGSDPWTAESTILATLIVAGGVAIAVAWWRAGLGGLLLLLVGVAHCVFAWSAAGRNKFFAVAITGLPFLLVGALFLLSWWLSRERDIAYS